MNAAVSWGKEWRVLRGGPIAALLTTSSWAMGPQPLAGHGPLVARGRMRLQDHLLHIADKVARMLSPWPGATHHQVQDQQAAASIVFIQERLDEFEALYARLANDASRKVLLALLQSRTSGESLAVRQDRARKHRQEDMLAAALVERDTRKPWPPYLNRYCLQGERGKRVLQCDEQALMQSLLCEAYAYDRDGVTIRVQPGDVVIDGGSRQGEAAVYFADLAWPSGHVYAIELEAGNAALVGENLVLNPRVRDSVTVIERALTDRSGDAIQYRARGAATSQVRIDQWGVALAQAPTMTIDDLVDELDLQQVNVIKLDLGGWERRALVGAQRTLARFRPALVVSVAHRLADLLAIPAELARLTADYEIFLDDVSTDLSRPIMFARPIPAPRAR